VLRGMLLCARFRPEGLAQFGDTSGAFLSSLLPLILFPLLLAVLQRPRAAGRHSPVRHHYGRAGHRGALSHGGAVLP
jgi:hypothetical protein